MVPEKKHLRKDKFLFLLLLFIAFDVICSNYIAGSFGNVSASKEFVLFISIILLQIFFSPLQAGASDIYGRKISLIISISFSLFSLLVVYFYSLNLLGFFSVFILMNPLKGVFGNTVPIAWAAIGDLANLQKSNLRFSFALTTAAYAIAYLVLIFLKKTFVDAKATLLLIGCFILLLFLCKNIFFDLKDAKPPEIKKLKGKFFDYLASEISLIKQYVSKKINQLIFSAWILWEISIYIILIYYADFTKYESWIIQVLMMCGYLSGTGIIKFLYKMPDSKMIRLGYITSSLALLPYFFLLNFCKNIDVVLSICCFFHAMGNAFISPTFLSIISNNHKDHERGKIYGLAESGDSIAFLIAGALIITLKFYKMTVFFLVCLSFFTTIIAWFPYNRFEKLSKKK